MNSNAKMAFDVTGIDTFYILSYNNNNNNNNINNNNNNNLFLKKRIITRFQRFLQIIRKI